MSGTTEAFIRPKGEVLADWIHTEAGIPNRIVECVHLLLRLKIQTRRVNAKQVRLCSHRKILLVGI